MESLPRAKWQVATGFLLLVYMAGQIIFQQESNVQYRNALNLLLVFVFLADSILNRNYKIPFNGYLLSYGVFVFFSFLSFFWSSLPEVSYNTNITLVQVCLNNFLIYALLKRYRISHWMLSGVVVGAFFNYLIALGVYTPSYEIYRSLRFGGTFPNSNQLGIAMMFSIFASLVFLRLYNNRYIQVVAVINIIFALYVSFLTGSRKGIFFSVILAAIFLITQFAKPRRILLFSLVILSIFYVFYDTFFSEGQMEVIEYSIDRADRMMDGFSGEEEEMEASTEGRILLAQKAGAVFLDNPFIGVGVNAFRYFTGGAYAHNNIMELLACLGLIGFTLYYLGYFLILRTYMMNKVAGNVLYFVLLLLILALDVGMVSYYEKGNLLMVVWLSAKLEERTEQEGLA